MEVVPGDSTEPTIWKDFNVIIQHAVEYPCPVEYLERSQFYERTKKAYSVVATSEKALYANIILKKGVIK